MKTSEIKVTMDKRSARDSFGGVTPKVMAEINGKQVMIKGGDDAKESFAEYFAYKLGKFLGIKVNKVKMVDFGHEFGLSKNCSVHWWENKFKRAVEVGAYEIKEEQKDIMNLFDYIINNTDRHSNNYGLKGKNIFLIDNGFAAPWDLKDIRYNRIKEYAQKVPDIIEKFLKLDEKKLLKLMKLPKGLDHNIDKVIIDKIVERFRLIQTFILTEVKKA